MGDQGHAGVELALAIAVLLVPAALAVLGFGPWVQRSTLAAAVAAEASRAAIVSVSLEEGLGVATRMAVNYGLEPEHLRLGWCGAEPVAGGAGECPLDRGSQVSAMVEVWVPLIDTPWGAVGGIWVGSEHSESVDIYRSLG